MAGAPRFSLGHLAELLHARMEGDPQRVVTGVAALDQAGPDDISFCLDGRHRSAARASRAAAFLVPEDLDGLSGRPLLRSGAPQQRLVDLLLLFHPPADAAAGIHPLAVVAEDAHVDPKAWIGALAVVESGAVVAAGAQIHPFAYVGARVAIGESSVLYPGVVVLERVQIGRRVIIHSGAVLGADGFGYAFDGSAHRKIPQVGTVVVEDDVEIGANTTIDRATLGATTVRRGTKIDNLVQIAHNVAVGDDSIIAAQTGIAGSSRLGRGVVLGGQVGIGDHVTIGDGAMMASQSGTSADIAAGEKMAGSWARPLLEARRLWVLQAQLPEMTQRLRALERRLQALEAALGTSSNSTDG